jgi:hypothetical protein
MAGGGQRLLVLRRFKGAYYQGCYAFRLHGGMRLVFRLMTAEERLAHEIPQETVALVIEIIDYHDG